MVIDVDLFEARGARSVANDKVMNPRFGDHAPGLGDFEGESPSVPPFLTTQAQHDIGNEFFVSTFVGLVTRFEGVDDVGQAGGGFEEFCEPLAPLMADVGAIEFARSGIETFNRIDDNQNLVFRVGKEGECRIKEAFQIRPVVAGRARLQVEKMDSVLLLFFVSLGRIIFGVGPSNDVSPCSFRISPVHGHDFDTFERLCGAGIFCVAGNFVYFGKLTYIGI
ncbi:MAG: hypothetical protein JST51_11770 [Armatimonadetes bacterium]|nr:hypothetical protein [Armatimonadota bacterium]